MRTQSRSNHSFPTVDSGLQSLSYTCSLFAALLLGSCGGSSGNSGGPSFPVPNFSAASFATPTSVNNPFFPLVPGTATAIFGGDGSDFETIIIDVLDDTRMVAGVECVVVRDRVFADELLIEDTHDWYAQDDSGNVWYMGEEVINYEYDDEGNETGTDTEGSWEAGLDVAGVGAVAAPGYVMLANPTQGANYAQESYPGEAEDVGRVVGTNVQITLQDGRTFTCLKIRDTSLIDPTANEFKYYAAGVGFVREETVGTTEALEQRGVFQLGIDEVPVFSAATFSNPSLLTHPALALEQEQVQTLVGVDEDETEIIYLEYLADTRMVAGVESAVVRDRVYIDGLLVEDTHDWFAQADNGDVWYMGEEVVNYEYDDEGKLTGTNSDSSWEAGMDILGTGTLAQPGILIAAIPTPGDSYYQEYYEGEAEDLAYVVAVNTEVEQLDGTVVTGVTQVLEWNPIEAGSLGYKFYSPGTGLVHEEPLDGLSGADLVGTFDLSAAALANFGSAAFTTPSLVDHNLLPFAMGTSSSFSKTTAEGLETIDIEVLTTTRMVMGIECVVVRDRAYLDTVIQEDTHDWYAQDDAGNVWYMGEEVVNYNYDESGVLIDTDNDGSWEAGLDVASVGSIAEPGYVMLANPTVGAAYRQEFYPDEAEDSAVVTSTDIDVELSGGTVFTGCLQVLEWNPLEPESLEYKYYAPTVGLIVEEEIGDDELVELDV